MRELEFRIDYTVAEGVNYNNYRYYGDGLPLYIDKGRCPEERLQQVTSDAALQRYCGHVSSDALYADHVVQMMSYSIAQVCFSKLPLQLFVIQHRHPSYAERVACRCWTSLTFDRSIGSRGPGRGQGLRALNAANMYLLMIQ